MWRSVGVCIVLLLVTVAAAQVTDRCGDPVVQARAKMYAVLHPYRNTSNVLQENSKYDDNFQCTVSTREDATLHDKRSPLNSVSDRNLTWPNGIIYYTIQKDSYTSDEISIIKNAMALLVNLTKVKGKDCVQIVPRTTETGYVNVIKGTGPCSSHIGRTGILQNLSLGPTCLTPRGIMHEFLHAFGFYHEQGRKDRDNYVWINYCNISPELDPQFAIENDDDPLGTHYDYKSIMQYQAYAYAVDPKLPTIIPKDLTVELIHRPSMSPIDIERVQIFYKCLATADSRFFKHLDRK